MIESETSRIGKQLGGAVGIGGTLRFFGDWFGRPHDNIHLLESVQVEGDSLLLHFRGGDLLRIWEPQGLGTRLPPEYKRDYAIPSFVIQRAARVRWETYYYGRPARPENRRFIEYTVQDRSVKRTSNWESNLLSEPTVDASSPAVALY